MRIHRAILWGAGALLGCGLALGQEPSAPLALPPLPDPQRLPVPGATNDAPYVPQPILPGGVVIPLYPPGSPFLKADRVREAEQYNVSKTVPGRISSIVNIHNPSIEVHRVEGGINTGAVVILAAGGGHNSLNVGTESADFVPFFYNYGINSVILRNRLRRDGYEPKVDAVHDVQQAIRMVRAYAPQWGFDPQKIGVMGFSAGAELSSPAALLFEEFDRTNRAPDDPFAAFSSRPNFVGIVYPGPTPFSWGSTPPLPRTTPPAFIVCAGAGDRGHAFWALDYYTAMLEAGVPNVELHVYGRGRHPGDPLPDGSRMSGGLTDRQGIPLGTWQDRFIDWFRDLGFLQKPGVETKAEQESRTYASQPPPPARGTRSGRGGTNAPAGRP